jgi:hypothetical protein
MYEKAKDRSRNVAGMAPDLLDEARRPAAAFAGTRLRQSVRVCGSADGRIWNIQHRAPTRIGKFAEFPEIGDPDAPVREAVSLAKRGPHCPGDHP